MCLHYVNVNYDLSIIKCNDRTEIEDVVRGPGEMGTRVMAPLCAGVLEKIANKFLSGVNETKEMTLMSQDRLCYTSTKSPCGTRYRETRTFH